MLAWVPVAPPVNCPPAGVETLVMPPAPPMPPACPPGWVALAKLLSAATMARSVAASLTASAFFSGTTQILPGRA
ncbi:hypothetical protein D9M72_548510 [compost metagenome]